MSYARSVRSAFPTTASTAPSARAQLLTGSVEAAIPTRLVTNTLEPDDQRYLLGKKKLPPSTRLVRGSSQPWRTALATCPLAPRRSWRSWADAGF